MLQNRKIGSNIFFITFMALNSCHKTTTMEITNRFLLSGDNITRLSCPKNKIKFKAGLPDTIVIHYTAGRSAEKQIDACNEVCRLLIEKFSVKTIVGHEEIAPGRKQDPGPAFALDQFREQLLLKNETDEPNLMDAQGEVTASLLNIRAGAGISFEKIAKPLVAGTKVTVLEEREGWFRVQTVVEGWVSKSHITIK